jgi:glycosyltransferase involved in cell wall biosynthesis
LKRVLQVVTELVVGGASLTMLDFAEDLAGEYELVIAHGRLEDPANVAVRRARARFPTYELPSLGRPIEGRADLQAARSFVALCRHVRPDLIHTHSSKAGLIGRLAPPPGAPPRLHTVHGWGHTPLDPPTRHRMLVAAERLAARRTTKLIAVSDEVRDEGLAVGIGRPAQYAVIGAPVDMRPHASYFDFDSARAEARARLRMPQDAEVIGWVGRFSPQKDPDALGAVIAELLATRPNAYAVLVGEGPERQVVEARLAAEIAARRVLLTGLREDARALYPAFDVLLHTSRWEGHPRAIREALAERVPVVTARVGGTGVIAADPRLGTVVEPGDRAAYGAALAMVLDARERRAPIGTQALLTLRRSADQPYGLMRELYARTLGQA